MSTPRKVSSSDVTGNSSPAMREATTQTVASTTRPSGSLLDALTRVTDDVAMLRDKIVNLFFVGKRDNWILVDTGMRGAVTPIKNAVAELYGSDARPRAIVLTHGHFDHVGAVKQLADEWDVPVLAHRLEVPYLTGRSSYPPPDPSVGGGVMPYTAVIFPRSPIDLGNRVQVLPDEGALPVMNEWQIVHTPGHTDGHISLFRQRDGFLIAGDAVTTTRQEALSFVLTQKEELNGPPKYFTTNWLLAAQSARKLAALQPQILATGHGRVMRGAKLTSELNELATHFETQAVPARGRYVAQPALADETGVRFIPPPISNPVPKLLLGIGAVGALALLLNLNRKRQTRRSNKSRIQPDSQFDDIPF